MLPLIVLAWVWGAVIFSAGTSAEEVNGVEQPRFNVIVKNVTVVTGQTAVLPCSVDYLGSYKVVWLDHRSKVLTLEDRRIIFDERITLERPYVKEWNLHIRSVKPSDQGMYTCQVNTKPVRVRTIWLHVHEPPKIIDHLSSSLNVLAREGETVTLWCNVTGMPPPDVTWYRIPTGLSQHGDREKEMIGVQGEVLVIHNVTRYCDDVYECVASNGVPPPATRDVRLRVEFPPEIMLPNAKMGQSRGKETILECRVMAFPQGMTVWRRNGKDLSQTWKYRIELYDEGENTITLSLRIRSIDEQDYGSYHCYAENMLGKDEEAMMLYEYPEYQPTPSPTTLRTTEVRWPDGELVDGGYDPNRYDPSRNPDANNIDTPRGSGNNPLIDNVPAAILPTPAPRGDMHTGGRGQSQDEDGLDEGPGYSNYRPGSRGQILGPNESAQHRVSKLLLLLPCLILVLTQRGVLQS